MRLVAIGLSVAFLLAGCATSPSPYSSPTYTSPTYSPSSGPSYPTYSPPAYRHYIRGPRGGCYYINSNGNKTYVDRSMCN